MSSKMSVPRPTGDRAGVDRPRTSPVPLLSAEGVAVHLLAFVRFLSGTGTRTAPSVEFGGFRWH